MHPTDDRGRGARWPVASRHDPVSDRALGEWSILSGRREARRARCALRPRPRGSPRAVLIGGLAAALHGSPYVTTDVDITPSRDADNLTRLAAALLELDARIRVDGERAGLSFDRSAAFLSRATILYLTTRFGELDLTFEPSGTTGYPDLRRHASELEIRDIRLLVASLGDVVRSREAANREKDRLVLPTLRRLLEQSSKKQ